MISNKALEIIANRKVSLEGTHPIRNTEYWIVADTKITVRKKKELNLETRKYSIKREYWCCCMDCSLNRIPNKLEPRCVFVEALKEYERRIRP